MPKKNKRKKRKGHGSAKGSRFERRICDELSLWWTGDPDASIFWRTAGSGARATVRAKKGKKLRHHCGDICATDPIGKPLTDVFAMELKVGYPSHSFANLLDRPKKGKVAGYELWIGQAMIAKTNADAFAWLLIHRRDRREPMVYMPSYAYQRLVDLGAANVRRPASGEFRITVRLPKHKYPTSVDVVTMPLADWLKDCKPEHIQALAEEV